MPPTPIPTPTPTISQEEYPLGTIIIGITGVVTLVCLFACFIIRHTKEKIKATLCCTKSDHLCGISLLSEQEHEKNPIINTDHLDTNYLSDLSAKSIGHSAAHLGGEDNDYMYESTQ